MYNHKAAKGYHFVYKNLGLFSSEKRMFVLSILVSNSFLKENSVLVKLLVLSFGVNHKLHVTSNIYLVLYYIFAPLLAHILVLIYML